MLLYDSVTPTDIPLGAPAVAGYVDGPAAWPAAGWQRFAAVPRVRISVTGDQSVEVIDCENGDLTPDEAAAWAAARTLQRGLPAVIYSALSNEPPVEAALARVGLAYSDPRSYPLPGVYRWRAHWTGTLALEPGCLATQYASPSTGSGGHYDLSATVGWWPAAVPIPVPPPPTTSEVSMVATDPTSGGTWTVEPDGSVWAAFGAPYCGGANKLGGGAVMVGEVVGIAARLFKDNEWGYVVVTRAGTPIGANDMGVDPGDIHRYYQFPREPA